MDYEKALELAREAIKLPDLPKTYGHYKELAIAIIKMAEINSALKVENERLAEAVDSDASILTDILGQQEQIDKLQAALKSAEDVIRFYATTKNWDRIKRLSSIIDGKENYWLADSPIEDDIGQRAREWLAIHAKDEKGDGK
jgi:hypothetical protein